MQRLFTGLQLLVFILTTFLMREVQAFNDDAVSKQEEILSFWFGELQNSKEWSQQKARLWFGGNKELDREIDRTFGKDVMKAANGDYADWEGTPRGRLALIILLDQFPRNIFRGTPEAYQFEHIAQRHCIEGVAMQLDQKLYPIERKFFYFPLMHSENIQHQEYALVLFQGLKEAAPESTYVYFSKVEAYAKKYFEIIKTYGRFPHRNVILNRKSTDAEIEYLKQSSSSYGQSLNVSQQ